MARIAAMKKVLSPISVTKIMNREFMAPATKLFVTAVSDATVAGSAIAGSAAAAVMASMLIKSKEYRGNGGKLTAGVCTLFKTHQTVRNMIVRLQYFWFR